VVQIVLELMLLLLAAVLVTLVVVGVPLALLYVMGVTVPKLLVTVVSSLVASLVTNFLMYCSWAGYVDDFISYVERRWRRGP
jgi:hypothetical protein